MYSVATNRVFWSFNFMGWRKIVSSSEKWNYFYQINQYSLLVWSKKSNLQLWGIYLSATHHNVLIFLYKYYFQCERSSTQHSEKWWNYPWNKVWAKYSCIFKKTDEITDLYRSNLYVHHCYGSYFYQCTLWIIPAVVSWYISNHYCECNYWYKKSST